MGKLGSRRVLGAFISIALWSANALALDPRKDIAQYVHMHWGSEQPFANMP